MSSIQVHILAGPEAGKRLLLRQDEVMFGRDKSCDVAIDLPFVSREHGRLRVEGGRWVLVNASANGTVLDGKLITKKPRAIRSPQVVSVGQSPIFEIVSAEVQDAAASDASAASAGAAVPGGGLSSRAKLWAGIGGFWLVVVIIAVVLKSTSNDSRQGAMPEAPRLTSEQIKAEIRKTPPKQPPDSRKAHEFLQIALDAYNQSKIDASALYRSLKAYQTALSYIEGPTLPEAIDQRRYLDVQQTLTDKVTESYDRAYNLLRNRRFDQADEAFRELMELYPDPSSLIFHSAQEQWNIAKAELKRR